MRGLDAVRMSDEVAQGRGRVRVDGDRFALCNAHRSAQVIVRVCHNFSHSCMSCRIVLQVRGDASASDGLVCAGDFVLDAFDRSQW